MGLPPQWDFLEFDPLHIQVSLRGVTADELRAQLAKQARDIELSVQKGSRYFVVFDARSSLRAPPEVRRIQAEWLAENAEALKATCLGIAFVIKERVVRGALTAIFWVTKSPVPYTVHATLDDAMEHGKNVLLDAGLTLPRSFYADPVARFEKALQEFLNEVDASGSTG